jgi:hypothetical protein
MRASARWSSAAWSFYARRPRRRISSAPFFVLYRTTAERIEILRVIDSRCFDSLLED